MIPKKIHYCWFGGNPLPHIAIKCMESWKKFCPDYEIIRWDESNCDMTTNLFVEQAWNPLFLGGVFNFNLVNHYCY